MVTGTIRASLIFPVTTVSHTTLSSPSLGSIIFPSLDRVPSIKNFRWFLWHKISVQYWFIIDKYKSLFYFWFLVMKKAPDFLKRIWIKAILRKSSAAPIMGVLMFYPKNRYGKTRKSRYDLWVGINIRGTWCFYYKLFNYLIAFLSTTTCS